MSLDFISMNYDKNSLIILIPFQIQMVPGNTFFEWKHMYETWRKLKNNESKY